MKKTSMDGPDEAEVARRRDEIVKRMQAMPPQPRTSKAKPLKPKSDKTGSKGHVRSVILVGAIALSVGVQPAAAASLSRGDALGLQQVMQEASDLSVEIAQAGSGLTRAAAEQSLTYEQVKEVRRYSDCLTVLEERSSSLQSEMYALWIMATFGALARDPLDKALATEMAKSQVLNTRRMIQLVRNNAIEEQGECQASALVVSKADKLLKVAGEASVQLESIATKVGA